MDYAPPPDLQGQYVFVKEAKSHFFWRGVFGAFAPTFSRRDLDYMEDQAEPRGEECMRGLKETGICTLKGLKAKNGDIVSMRLDRGCAIAERSGAITGAAVFPVPEKIGKLLPAPANPAPPLDCSKPGLTHMLLKDGPASAVPLSFLPQQGRFSPTHAWSAATGRPYGVRPLAYGPTVVRSGAVKLRMG